MRSWRTLVRIEEVSGPWAQVVVPGWSDRLISVKIPEHIQNSIKELPFRCYAKVNIGAVVETDLVFEKWELTNG